MGTLENIDVNNLGDSNGRMNKEEARNKIYKDKNVEKAIKEGVENFLDNTVLKRYSQNAVSEYEYINKFTLITTEIFEDGWVSSDVHIDVNMIIYDYSSADNNKMERYVALNNNYLIGLNLKFYLNNIEIENIQARYFSVYGFSNNSL